MTTVRTNSLGLRCYLTIEFLRKIVETPEKLRFSTATSYYTKQFVMVLQRAEAHPISRMATSGPLTQGAFASQTLGWRGRNTVLSHLLRYVLPYTRVVLAAVQVWA